MEQSDDGLNCSELKAELQALHQKLKSLEARQASFKPLPVARAGGFARGMVLGLVLLVSAALLIGSLLNAQSGTRAFFIDEQGNVAVATNLDAGGKIKARTFEGDGSALNLEGNKSINVLQVQKLDKTGGAISGKLAIAGKSSGAGPALNVDGDITADNVWTKLHDVQLSSAADYTVQGINGDAYRRFRVELEGTLTTENRYGSRDWSKAIGLRPNGSTANYGTHQDLQVAPWTMGQNETDFLPLCISHWQLDGQLSCTGEMNAHTGMFRVMKSESTFVTLRECGPNFWQSPHRSCMSSQDAANVWLDQTTNITSLTLYFGRASGFTGRFVLYGKK